MPFSSLTSWIEEAANRLLALDPDTRAQLGTLSGKIIRIECTAPAVTFFLIPTATGVRVLHESPQAADVSLRATLSTFLTLALARNPDMAALRAVEIDGDIELGQRIQRIWQRFDVDWEEQAARVFGDIVAHRTGTIVRNGATWMRSAAAIIGRDLAEFLHYEAQMLPPRAQIDAFLQAVDTLRADTDRLAQRIQHLHSL